MKTMRNLDLAGKLTMGTSMIDRDKGRESMKGTGTLAKASLAGMLVSLLAVLCLLVCSTTTFAGAPPKNSYAAIVDSGATLQPDGSEQTIGTSAISLSSGGGAVTTYTVTILGTSTVAAGEVTGVVVTDGTSTWSASGSYGPGSVVACTGANATPVDAGTLTIRLTLAAASAGKTVGVELTSEDSGVASGLPTAGTLHNIFAPADTLSVTANTPVATSGSPGNTDVQMQYLQVDTDNAGDGSIEVTTVTVDDLGTAAAGDIDFMKVHIDDDTNFGNGVLDTISTATWDGTSTAVDITAMAAATRTVSFGTSKYIWITYDLNAGIVDGTTLQSSVTSIAVAGGDSGASGTWNSNNFATSSGPSNTLADCAGCHEYPPVDAGSRDASTGNFVGDHDKHNTYTCATCHIAPGSETSIDFAHRTGTLNMDSGNIGVGTDNGTYSKGATFAQSNSPTTGTCSNVDCHNNAVTPQWGVGTTACDTCHALPPATNAHSTHYTAKGWATGNTTNCTQCHPDNTGGHTDVTDTSVIVNAGLTPGGTTPAITCATTGTGCHNGNSSPAWNTTGIACTACHTVGGGNTATEANPVSGLHNMTAAGVQKHDNSISINLCDECHTKASISGHWDGVASATADYNSAAVGISFASGSYTDAGGTAASRGTCTSTCHSDGGNWQRQWSTAADSIVTTAGDARCEVCHGQFGSWRTGSVHAGTFGGSASTRGNSHNSLGGATNGCEDCHSYPSLANHEDTFITMNDGGATTVTNTGNPNYRIYCAKCHSDDGAPTTSGTHTFPASSFTLATVSGANDPVGSCTSCHGGGTTGTTEKSYWPDNSTAHAANTDANGRHAFHMSQIATVLYGETITGAADNDILMDNTTANPGVTSDTKQKAICEYCHAANLNDSDHTATYPADVFVDADAVRHANSLWGVADADASYDAGLDTCSNVDCHNSKLTTDGTYGWYDAGTSTCLMCHTVGGAGANPTSGAHNLTQAGTTAHDDNFGSGYGCTDCHQSPATNAHIDGTTNTPATATFNWNLTGKTITLNAAADNTDNTCTATTCHSDGGDWERQWSTAADSTATAAGSVRCDVCHGQFNNWRAGTSHAAAAEQNRGDTHNSLTGVANGCEDCHVYPSVSANHNNNAININDSAGVTSLSGRTWCGGCHSDDGAPGTASTHTFEQSTFTRVEVAGANDPQGDCTACHAAGKSGAIVTSTSPHVVTTVGGTFNACTDCHPGGSVGSMHSNTGAIAVPNNATAGIDINYQDGISGGGAYSGYAGIVLGGDDANAAPGSLTEAEWCWQCHQAQTPDISEWDGGTATYDYGAVTADNLNWTTTSWSSAVFSYKNGLLNAAPGTQASASTHGTNGGVAGVDALADISCSYCHDVHDTAGGSTGAPFLRGNWTSNPFKEDGAPGQPGSVAIWTDSFARGNLPRASASMGNAANNEYGGWQTEDNNTYTRSGNATTHGGLCLSCHTEATLVTAWNSHANIVDGFTPSGALDIFDVSYRMNTSYAEAGDVRFAYPHHLGIGADDTKKRGQFDGGSTTAGYVAGYRDGNAVKDSFMTDTAGKPGNGDPEALTAHVATLTGNAVDANFHQFPCAKCHNPHASRLPKLMITNCLDVQKNAWDDTLDTTTWGPSSGISVGTVRYTATQLGYSSTSGNCHRYVMSTDTNADDGQVTSPSNRSGVTQGGGWNKVTPW